MKCICDIDKKMLFARSCCSEWARSSTSVCFFTSHCPLGGAWPAWARWRGPWPPSPGRQRTSPSTRHSPGAFSINISVNWITQVWVCHSQSQFIPEDTSPEDLKSHIVTTESKPSSKSSSSSFMSTFSLAENLSCYNQPIEFHQVMLLSIVRY